MNMNNLQGDTGMTGVWGTPNWCIRASKHRLRVGSTPSFQVPMHSWHYLYGPQFPHLENGNKKGSYFAGSPRELSELAQCLTHPTGEINGDIATYHHHSSTDGLRLMEGMGPAQGHRLGKVGLKIWTSVFNSMEVLPPTPWRGPTQSQGLLVSPFLKMSTTWRPATDLAWQVTRSPWVARTPTVQQRRCRWAEGGPNGRLEPSTGCSTHACYYYYLVITIIRSPYC